MLSELAILSANTALWLPRWWQAGLHICSEHQGPSGLVQSTVSHIAGLSSCLSRLNNFNGSFPKAMVNEAWKCIPRLWPLYYQHFQSIQKIALIIFISLFSLLAIPFNWYRLSLMWGSSWLFFSKVSFLKKNHRLES